MKLLMKFNHNQPVWGISTPAGRQTTHCIVLISTDTDIMQYGTLQGNILSPTAAMCTAQ